MIITKIEQQKKHKNRSSVFIDDEFAFGIDDFDLFNLKLKIGTEISQERLIEIKETILFSSAKEYSVKIISRFSYTKKSMRIKLADRGYDNEIIDKTIDFLENYKFIDDYEYAKRYINDALTIKHTAVKKIKYDLLQKGIEDNIINQAMSEFDVNSLELDAILKLAKKRINENYDYKNILKVKRYLASKGYSFDIIDKTIDIVINQREGE